MQRCRWKKEAYLQKYYKKNRWTEKCIHNGVKDYCSHCRYCSYHHNFPYLFSFQCFKFYAILPSSIESFKYYLYVSIFRRSYRYTPKSGELLLIRKSYLNLEPMLNISFFPTFLSTRP